MKKIAPFFFLLALPGLVWAEAVTILGINDMHAGIDNLPRLAGFLKAERAATPDALLMSAGDNRTGNPYVDAVSEPGMPMIKLMNQMKFDISTLGNHEFDSGEEMLRNCINAAHFPFVCANVHATAEAELNLPPYHFFERNGVRICVLGLLQTGINGLPDVHPAQVKNLKFSNPFEIVRNYAFLRKQCDVLILLTHLGFEDDVKLAKMFPEADIIIGGHSHTRVEKETVVNGVLVTQTENKAKYISRIVLDVDKGKIKSRKYELVPLHNVEEDADMAAAVREVKNNPDMLRRLTTVKAPIERRESLGCMMADAVRHAAGTDVAIVNIGNVRMHHFPAGPLCVEDCFRIDPFGNKIAVLKVSGKELIVFLNAVPTADRHGAPCVSGMRYKATKPAAALQPMVISEAYLENGTPITPNGTYTMATNTYLLSTVPALPADTGKALNIDGANSMIQFLDAKQEIDYANVSRVDITIQETSTP